MQIISGNLHNENTTTTARVNKVKPQTSAVTITFLFYRCRAGYMASNLSVRTVVLFQGVAKGKTPLIGFKCHSSES